MQQTETLKLNLIETGDPISPAPINENAEKIEAALAAKADAALEQRITVLEAKKFVCGSYTASSDMIVELGFTPVAVLVHQTKGGLKGVTALTVTGQGNEGGLDIVEGGFHTNPQYGTTSLSGIYTYIAFG